MVDDTTAYVPLISKIHTFGGNTYSESEGLLCHPTWIGINDRMREIVHTKAIAIATFFQFIHRAYFRGSLICIYLSNEITHRLSMEAVEPIISEEIQMLQNIGPNSQLPVMSFMTANVMTTKAIHKSATASDTMNKLFSRFNRLSVNTAIQTSKLPEIAKNMSSTSRVPIKTRWVMLSSVASFSSLGTVVFTSVWFPFVIVVVVSVVVCVLRVCNPITV